MSDHQQIRVEEDNQSSEYWKGVIHGNEQAEDIYKESNKMRKPAVILGVLGAVVFSGATFVIGYFMNH